MRKLLFGLLVLTSLALKAQVYNNEWIDYSKTYYKFKVGKDGLYRISGASLAAAGLSSATAQSFQLWRNGVEVPIFTSVASGPLAPTDYIEFWGKMNDGKPDKELYRDTTFQLNDKWSLISDSAAYFITSNNSSTNRRLLPTANNVAGNILPAEPYFMYTAGQYFNVKINPGLYYLVGVDHLFSSSYDKGEGWTSDDIERNGVLTTNFSGLFAAASGPAPKLRINTSGNAYNSRRYLITLNGDSVGGSPVPYLNQMEEEETFNLTLLTTGTASVGIKNITETCDTAGCPTDRMVVHKLELVYPRQFNFNNAANFEFTLASSIAGSYLEISGFSHGGVAPVLYDLTNGKRYVGEISGSLVKVVLDPSATSRDLVLVSEAGGNIASVSALQSRSFTNYSVAANQGDFLVISNASLLNGSAGSNPLEDYRLYRASPQGGAYNAKLYLEDQLTDQFGFGIKKNPAGVRNFIRFARKKFLITPKNVFIIGRGVHYLDQRRFEANFSQTVKDNLDKLNLVPTYGWPASDILLAADPGSSSPAIPIGRLTAITPAEVALYLKKVKETEQAQQTLSPTIGDKAWMKNVAHIAGAGEEPLASQLVGFLKTYEKVISDTLYGANVSTFAKTTSNFVEQLSDADLTNLFNQGISLITYYGHSSPTTLEFNLDDPANYNNPGKYPMFFALGCNAGNTFDYNEGRFADRNYLSDKYVLAQDRGSINFVGSSHFGIVHYLDIWNSRAYSNMAGPLYARPIGDILKKTIDDVYAFTSTDDFFARCNAEQIVLNGDPAMRLNQQTKPDYVIVDSMLKVTPNFISTFDHSFRVNINVMNLGKAVNRKSVVETKQQFPDGSVQVVHRDTLSGTRYRDTISFTLPIDPTKDKGNNRLYVTVDADNVIDELFETNNSTSRDFIIIEDEARPVYPNNFAIVNNRNITLKASTANPFSPSKQYRMEIDTSELFDSPLKATSTLTSVGGLLEFAPGISFTDSTVYYWRVAPVPATGSLVWNTNSFIYISNSASGFNQSHYYQFQKSTHQNLKLDAGTRAWQFDSILNNLVVKNGVFPTASGQEADFSVAVNGSKYIRSACVGFSLIFNVIDPHTFKPLENYSGFMNSGPYCAPGRQWNFEYSFQSRAARKDAMDFMDWIPNGSYVVVRNITGNGQANNFIDEWKADTAAFGSGNSLYHKLKNIGLSVLDQYTTPKAWAIVYQKNVNGYTPVQSITTGIYDLLTMTAYGKSPDSIGYITSPAFGPAKTWKEFRWRGTSLESPATDGATTRIIGVKNDGTTDTLTQSIPLTQAVTDISSINATQYPYLKLAMRNIDSINFSPYQLKYWRLTYDPVPEGAVTPNVQFSMKDTFDVGEPLNFKLAFKNISDIAFSDSIAVKVIAYDRNNTARTIQVPKQKKPLNPGEVLNLQFDMDTKQLVGANTLYVELNPDNAQLEQYHFNNFIFRNFYVRGDTLNPLMDVTFDNVHILNRDIVSSKPHILVKLKDEAKWMLLNDPSITTVQVRYPDASGSLGPNSVTKTFAFSPDTLKFIPATGAPNGNNTASIEFSPYFQKDGEYELVITGKDMSNNTAGSMSYRVAFDVINKPMISNMLNYPNPFTTSTAFVFTLTGTEVPQNIKIQILTVTGKIVKEITKAELGPLRIGRNITEYKWDGTDQYGQKLGNGVYLYHVVTNLNGKSLDKYTSDSDNTDKYFTKGYGKMYLMR